MLSLSARGRRLLSALQASDLRKIAKVPLPLGRWRLVWRPADVPSFIASLPVTRPPELGEVSVTTTSRAFRAAVRCSELALIVVDPPPAPPPPAPPSLAPLGGELARPLAGVTLNLYESVSPSPMIAT